MGNAKNAQSGASKISAPAAPATNTSPQSSSRSSIFKSSFAPSCFQLALFASVIQGIDSQHLRVHDTNTGLLRCEHVIAPRATINCLDWGYYGEGQWGRDRKEAKKKRKRSENHNGTSAESDTQECVIGLGTSESEIHMYSPIRARTVGILRNEHVQGIKDFKFVQDGKGSEAWSLGGDGKLVLWDLTNNKSKRTIVPPEQTMRVLCPFGSSVLCASHKVVLIDSNSSDQHLSYVASRNFIHSLRASAFSLEKPSNPGLFLTAADTDRFVNIYSTDTEGAIGSLVAESDVLSISISSTARNERPLSKGPESESPSEQALIAITKDGTLELFEAPFRFSATSSPSKSESLKARIKGRTRKSTALISIVRPEKSTSTVPLLAASFLGNDLILAWTEGGVELVFERVRWREEKTGELVLKGVQQIAKAKGDTAIGAVVMNGIKDMSKIQVNESQTVVATGGASEYVQTAVDRPEVIDISSEEEVTDYEDDDLPEATSHTASDVDPSMETMLQKMGKSKPQQEDTHMADADDQGSMEVDDTEVSEAAVGATEPTFGEMIKANAPEPVDVQAVLATSDARTRLPAQEGTLQAPSGMSLSTVLTQALRTNDISLLETCLHMKDLAIIRATIERLESSLATLLVEKLAERLHSRPGRAGSLMVWIQWTMVAHGGYLASQSKAMRVLASLHQVVGERARSLPLLLSLKGKLDMLEAQMNLRRIAQSRSGMSKIGNEVDEEGVIYVEGEESSDSEDGQGREGEDEEEASGTWQVDQDMDRGTSGDEDGSENEGSNDEVSRRPKLTNGTLTESDEESNSEGDGMIDDEASSTDQDSDEEGSAEEIDHEDMDSIDSDNSSEPEEVRPPKRPATIKLSNGVGSQKR